MGKENVVHILNGVIVSQKEEQKQVICRKMNSTRDHRVK